MRRTRGFGLRRLVSLPVDLAHRCVSTPLAIAAQLIGLASQLCTRLHAWRLVSAPLLLSLAVLDLHRHVAPAGLTHRLAPPQQLLLARWAALGSAVYTVGGSEGLRRSVSFNTQMMPMVIHYRLVQADLRLRRRPQHARAARYDALHKRYAQLPLRVALDLGGFYTKIAQVMSSFGEELIPKPFVEALRVLQDSAPSRPASYVRAVISEELGVPSEQLFASIDDVPLGAASIGQVHRATLCGSGEEVVVKVQYPRAKHYFGIDMRTITRFCRVAFPEQVPLMREIERQFLTEFDYVLEAALMRRAAANLMPTFGRRVAVPLPIDAQHPATLLPRGMCTERVLTMERLRGTSLLRAQRAQLAATARHLGRTSHDLEEELRARFRRGELQGSGGGVRLAAYAALRSASDAASNGLALAHNAYVGLAETLGLYPSGANRSSTGWARRDLVRTPPPLDAARLIRRLFEVHAHQLFEDGFFNGDPHPGNILLLDDGRLGLIDWGQVKVLGLAERLQFAKLVVALADRDQQLTAQLWGECGFATEKNHPWALDKWACWRFSRFTADVVDELGGVVEFEPNLAKRDPPRHEPDEFVMVYRLTALLRGNAMSLGDFGVDAARLWRGAAARLLRKHGVPLPDTVRGRRLPEMLDEAGRVVART